MARTSTWSSVASHQRLVQACSQLVRPVGQLKPERAFLGRVVDLCQLEQNSSQLQSTDWRWRKGLEELHWGFRPDGRSVSIGSAHQPKERNASAHKGQQIPKPPAEQRARRPLATNDCALGGSVSDEHTLDRSGVRPGAEASSILAQRSSLLTLRRQICADGSLRAICSGLG